MVSPTIAVGHPEPVIVDRMTRGGRHLWYHLEVIQQPERARACGAGPKSSADRRPVDPPPVVELRIFEGPTIEHAKDITFTYNANFFLFATLEHARVLAHGRVQAPSAATPPVLTGMPVSGMAYLDRPKEAGYFLFPDLSVRHEGRYRLTFNLYEQTKESADFDKEMHDVTHTAESFDWRMEVKSNDFMVFSAKKFPGLTESTALSRTVAEQGCRVRIRRDVRMRRREGKSSAAAAPGSGADARSAEEEFARRHRTQTPEVAVDYRQRSMSIESGNRTPYSSDPSMHAQRRPSVNEYHHPAPSPIAGPSIPPAFNAAAQNGNSHLRFGGNNQPTNFIQPSSVPPSPTYSHHSYSQAPIQPQQQAPPPPHHHVQRHSSSSFSAPSPSPSHAGTPVHGYYQDRPTSQHYTTTPASSASIAAPSPNRDSFSSATTDYRRQSNSSNSYVSPPTPIEPANDVRRPESSNAFTLPPLSELINYKGDKQTSPGVDRVSSISQLLQPQSVLPHPGTPNLNKKRSYGQYNNLDLSSEAYVANASIKNHARQSEQTPREVDELWWKRADGSVWTPNGEIAVQQRG